MISLIDLNLHLELNLFNNTFITDNNYFSFNNDTTLLALLNYSDYGLLILNNETNLHVKSLIAFINQTEDINLFDNLENVKTIYHYSIPNTKLAYPEPFIASASFMHNDLWFIHILTYQYWLWFVFIFLIIFFFTTFITILRWCNMRVRPRRETRGVSRSKCADLITATVPVSWATSIIVSESTDAIDYYDGFGTTELVVGVRAYQWGWEYYYQKDIDLHYNIKHNYSSFVGNSLKYHSASDVNLHANNLWKYYQNKTFDNIITPAHLLVLPNDNLKLLNFLNLNDSGSNPLYESSAFKKIRMFSKTFSANLTFAPNSFHSNYKHFSNFFFNENSFNESMTYGLKRQHNFLTNSAISNNTSTFFNLKSSTKWLNFNLNTNNDLFNTFSGNYYFKFFNKNNFNNTLITNNRSHLFLNKYFFNEHSLSIFKNNSYSSVLNLINDDTDKKKIKYPIFKLLNLTSKKAKFLEKSKLFGLIYNNDLTNFFENEKNYFLKNNNVSYKKHSSFSSNQAFPLSTRSVKKLTSIKPTASSFNFNSNLNSVNNHLNYSSLNLSTNPNFFFNLSNLKWADLNTLNKLSTSRFYVDSPFTPITSNYPFTNLLNYDDYNHTFNKTVPTLLQGREELTPTAVSSIYWNFYWSNTNQNWRVNNSLIYNKIHNNFYMPLFNFYYDYDFRNWQTLELLEDAFWESLFSIYTIDEYLTLAKEFYEDDYIDKNSKLFYQFDKIGIFKNQLISKSYLKTKNSTGEFYSNFFYLDDFISPTKFLSTADYSLFSTYAFNNNIEDSYESFKFLNYVYNFSNKISLLNLTSFFIPHSYSFVFDMFRSDYDEFSWFIDEKNFDDSEETNLSSTKDLRFSNYINLRNSVRNSIVTYNAIQKVFKARFDEGRSNTKLLDFGNFYNKHPFISSPRIQYEKLLGKNKENFFKINLYKTNFFSLFNSFYTSFSSLNFYTFDFPFLLAMKSDASRYLWFDWFAKWGMYEVQPSSASRYALYGMPYFSKNFEFSSSMGENLNEVETYLLRLSRARKNYLPNWVYTPYFYSRNNAWYKNNIILDLWNTKHVTIFNTYTILNLMSWYWNKLHFLNSNSFLFTPSNSNINSYARGTWKPQASIQSYYFSVSHLIDILTKREYLYRQLFESNNKLINLPFYLTANPKNPLVNELKNAFLFADPINLMSSYSRENYASSLSFFNYHLLKFIFNSSNFINTSLLSDYLFFYFFNSDYSINKIKNLELYKNQYRPLRKGISNMIRLHATGAIAMPTEIRLQILASSKDVIHSWAIPSAGIKIDCVPGYSSHKVTIFLVSGIFWGQCMEICGRYHHWMPIVVYFMKRDLFFLWCTHFVFLSGANNAWNINDRQYVDYIRYASFDKNSWINELNL